MFLCRCVGIPHGAHLDDGCVGSVDGDVAMGACEAMSVALMLETPRRIMSLFARGVAFCFPYAERGWRCGAATLHAWGSWDRHKCPGAPCCEDCRQHLVVIVHGFVRCI